jgi:hypothetical protein
LESVPGVSEEVRPAKIRKLVQSATHTLRGLTDGCLIINDRVAKQPCIVIGDCFPNWLLFVAELGYRVDHVLIKSSCHVTLIHRICEADVAVWCGAHLEALVSRLLLQVASVMCFLDGRVTSGLLEALDVVGIGEVISTQTPWRPCCGWHSVFINVPHSAVGGVTTRVVSVVRHSKTALTGFPLPLEITAERDAATVLSHSTFGRYFRPKPDSTLVEPLRCFNLGSIHHPYYHGYGWLPTVLD